MKYSKLQRLAKSKNIRITKNTSNGRKYLTSAELMKKLKKRKSRSKKISLKRRRSTRSYGGIFGSLFSGTGRRKLKKRKYRKVCKGKCRKGCKCRKGMKYRKGSRSGSDKAANSGAMLALKTMATGAAIHIGSELAKRAIAMQ